MENTLKTYIPKDNVLESFQHVEWVQFADKNYLPMHFTIVDGVKYYIGVYQDNRYEATINGFMPVFNKGVIN